MKYDVIVVGVGGMGSATAYHLAKRGCTVLGLEQFDIGHDRGSSHGINRIIRLAYAEDPRYVPLLRRAYELWREIEHRAGERLLFITGGIDAGPQDGSIVQGSLRSCKEHCLPHELLDSADRRRRILLADGNCRRISAGHRFRVGTPSRSCPPLPPPRHELISSYNYLT